MCSASQYSISAWPLEVFISGWHVQWVSWKACNGIDRCGFSRQFLVRRWRQLVQTFTVLKVDLSEVKIFIPICFQRDGKPIYSAASVSKTQDISNDTKNVFFFPPLYLALWCQLQPQPQTTTPNIEFSFVINFSVRTNKKEIHILIE